MNLNEIKALLKDVDNADAIIAEINKQNGLDIKKYKDQVDTLTAEKKSLEEKVTELSESTKGAEDTKKELDDLKQKIADDQKAAEEAKAEAAKAEAYNGRFTKVLGENKFRDELTENAVKDLFFKAIEDANNNGKGDSNILEEITKDKGFFANPNQPGKMPETNAGGTVKVADDARLRKIMGLPEAAK